jgi:hypothetical protein
MATNSVSKITLRKVGASTDQDRSKTLPSTRIDLALELPGHHARHRAVEPGLAQDLVVAALVQEQLQVAAQRRVDFAKLVQVGRDGPAAGLLVQVQYAALADVEEQAC